MDRGRAPSECIQIVSGDTWRVLYASDEGLERLGLSAETSCAGVHISEWAGLVFHEDGTPWPMEDWPLTRLLRGERAPELLRPSIAKMQSPHTGDWLRIETWYYPMPNNDVAMHNYAANEYPVGVDPVDVFADACSFCAASLPRQDRFGQALDLLARGLKEGPGPRLHLVSDEDDGPVEEDKGRAQEG